MGYDLRPLVTMEEKQRIIPQAEKEGWILFFEHDPETIAVNLQKTEKGFTIKEKFTF